MIEIIQDPAKPGDFSPGRRGIAIDTIVLHTTEGSTIAGATSWWDRENVVASSHYLIDGKRIVQRVAEMDAAYHAGSGSMNRRSIGIEVVGRAGKPETWTPEVMAQLVALCADICDRRRQIPTYRGFPGIIGHCDVPDPRDPSKLGGASHHTDPGSFFPWSEFFVSLRAALAQGKDIA